MDNDNNVDMSSTKEKKDNKKKSLKSYIKEKKDK